MGLFAVALRGVISSGNCQVPRHRKNLEIMRDFLPFLSLFSLLSFSSPAEGGGRDMYTHFVVSRKGRRPTNCMYGNCNSQGKYITAASLSGESKSNLNVTFIWTRRGDTGDRVEIDSDFFFLFIFRESRAGAWRGQEKINSTVIIL